MKLEVITNQVKISSLQEFISLDNRCNNMTKHTVFVIQTGITGEQEFLNTLKEADKSLVDIEKGSKSWYLRTGRLESFIENDKKEEYLTLAEKWLNSRKTEECMNVMLPFEFENSLWNITYKQAFRQVVTEYIGQETGNLKDLRVSNFMVVLLFRIAAYFPKLFKNTRTLSKFPKMIYTDVVGTNEYYFLRLLNLCGGDIYCIDPRLTLKIKADNLSAHTQIIKKEQEVKCRIPDYDAEQIVKELNNMQKHSVLPRKPIQTEKRKDSSVKLAEQNAGNGFGVDITRPPKRHKMGEAASIRKRSELSYEELAGLASSIVMIQVYDEYNKPFASGSGVLINEEGYILTNFHVIRNAAAYGVCLEEEEELRFTTELIKYHPENDLALIRIEPVDRKPIPLYQGEKLVRGQKVVAIGSPLGLFNTVSDGIIAGFRNISEVSMIQFTAPTSPGSSGGALLNLYGELIGIVTGGFDDGQNLNLAVDYKTVSGFLRGFI